MTIFCLEHKDQEPCRMAYVDLEKMMLFMISLDTQEKNPLFYASLDAIVAISTLNPRFADVYMNISKI